MRSVHEQCTVVVQVVVLLGKWSESCFDTDWVYEIFVIGR